MKRLSTIVLAGGLLASVALTGACGGKEDERTGVSITLRGPNDNHASDIFGFPEALINSIASVRISAFQGFSLAEQVEFDYTALEGELPTINYGEDNWLAVEGLDANGGVVASGASQWFTLEPGDSPVSLEIFTSRVRRFTTGFRFDGAVNQSVPSGFELPAGRAGASMVTLPDGRIVVLGGAQVALTGGVPALTTYFDTVQIYQPSDGNWFTLTVPGCDVATLGVDACATKLPQPVAFAAAATLDENRIVISGGLARDPDLEVDVASARVAVLEMVGGLEATITPVAASATGGAIAARAFHTATQVTDGRILFVGGMTGQYNNPSFPTGVDQVTRQGTLIYEGTGASLTQGRALHTATNFDAGDHGIIVVGGRNGSAAIGLSEVVFLSGGSVLTEAFTARPGSVDLATARFGHTALTYGCPGSDKRYLFVAGGFTSPGTTLLQGSAPSDIAEVYDPAGLNVADTYTFLRDDALRLARPRAFAAGAGLLGSGDVIIAGGTDGEGGVLESAEVFTNIDWTNCGSFTRLGGNGAAAVDRSEVADGLVTARAMSTAVTLDSQYVFFVGGTDGTNSLASSEFYNANDYAIIYGTGSN